MSQNIEELISHNTFARHNGIVFQESQDGRYIVYVDPNENSYNPYDTIHGGLFFTIADNCAGGAARSDGRRWVTQGASVSYLRAVKEGRITGVAQVVHRGRKTCIIDVKVYNTASEVVFIGTFTYYCID